MAADTSGSDYPLTEFGLDPKGTVALDNQTRTRLLNFLLNWRHLSALHACLDANLANRPQLVSLLDLRVRAHVIEERYEEAIELMQQRLDIRWSASAQSLLARVYLEAGDTKSAAEIAQALQSEAPDQAKTWYIAGELALVEGNVQAALAAYQRASEIGAVGRGYLLGMLKAYQAREDWVTASGYAVRLLESVEHLADLPVTYLRTLRAYFVASSEATHVAELDEAIRQRYEAEVQALQDVLRAAGPATEGETVSDLEGALPAQAGTRPEAGREPKELRIEATDVEHRTVSEAVRDIFGFTDLLPGQLETMACVLRGGNALTVLPTGGGKSLCYQVPAFLSDSGLTLVVSPLIALMKDQVDSLPERLQSKATTINSTLDGDVLRERLDRAVKGDYRLLYAAPERLRQPAFLHALRRAGVNRLVVDEAHCVSVWGHDFRPDYLKIRAAWQALGGPPILALTATAPPRVRRDIVQHLSPDQPMAVVTGDLTRPNLRLEVFSASNQDEKLYRLIGFCQNTEGSGIVYADTRARCERLAEVLRQQGVDAAHYHAGISNRDGVQDDFMTGKTRVIVATIAFGMGIDKPDIRFVVHYTPPASLESYYQEAGRAGRDGAPARCLLMFSSADRGTLTRRMHQSLPHVDFLRNVYAAVLRHLNGAKATGIASGDLERELHADGTEVRVALSILEENGLIERGPDIPRAALIRLCPSRRRQDADDDRLQAFYAAGRLQSGQWTRVDLINVAEQVGCPPGDIEELILRWSDKGYLDTRFSGRDMLIAQAEPPDDVADRISRWLDRFETIQVQRIAEIVGYARTRRCRHGHLNAYLGGRRIDHCNACDNCVAIAPDEQTDTPEEHEQLAAILNCAARAPWSWGRYNLVLILQGNPKAPAKAQGYPGYGSLSFRSRTAIEDLIDRLEQAGFLAPRELDNGGTVLDLTPSGHAVLRTPDSLTRIAPKRQTQGMGQTAFIAIAPKEMDEALYDKLRAWRTEKARETKVPAYVILHNSQLKGIATERPRTPEALLGVNGIGPKRLASYGKEILGIIAAHMSEQD
ncbi:MAG: RecQ family ATP-dependent DNA helicase [Anaerolineae bacterium]|nr:RecQ family ATP-dependent DNA helicase [Anaerolineae bacterium]